MNESILIGDNIRVVVVRIKGDQVRIGVEADPSVAIDRPEVREAKLRYPDADSYGDTPELGDHPC